MDSLAFHSLYSSMKTGESSRTATKWLVRLFSHLLFLKPSMNFEPQESPSNTNEIQFIKLILN